MKYARARTYFEAQHWEEAAVAFRDVALNHSDHESAPYAAQLWLEALNVLFSYADPKRPGLPRRSLGGHGSDRRQVLRKEPARRGWRASASS